MSPSSTFEANIDGRRAASLDRDALRADEIPADEGFDLVLSSKSIACSPQLGVCGAGSAPGAPAIPIETVCVPSAGTTSARVREGCQKCRLRK
jgi:hypothetical protein